MWLAQFKLSILSIAALGTINNRRFVSSEQDEDVVTTIDVLKKKMNNPNGQDRIKVPLGRRLADVIADHDGEQQSQSNYPHDSTPRRYEIEADDDDDDDTTNNDNGSSTTTSLLVEQVQTMAITSATTYSFHNSRSFNSSTIKDISILASNPKEVDGLIIMSINKSNGDVRGLMRRESTGHMHQITSMENEDHNDNNDDDVVDDATDNGIHNRRNGRRLRLKKMERSLGESGFAAKNWTCGSAHAHDDDPLRWREHGSIYGDEDDLHDHNHHQHEHQHHQHEHSQHDHQHDHSQRFPFQGEFTRSTNLNNNNNNNHNFFKSTPNNERARSSSSTGGIANPNPNYSFHIDLSIDIDKYFIEKQGSTEAAVEYINVLVSAANVVFEHEVDAHLNIVHIQEREIYDKLTTTKEALKEMRLHPKPYQTDSQSNAKIILHHALLGRYIGGGIAFIDSICDTQWGYGVTSDISGSLAKIDDLVLFDFFIVTHEIGHSLGSGHTFDAYDPPVDVCGACTVDSNSQDGGGGSDDGKVEIEGLPRKNAATLMSYCNFCDGGLDNIAITLGGVWDGKEPRANVERWDDHPDIVGRVSVDPRRVSHNVWTRLSSKGECVRPPSDPVAILGCNDDGDCDDGNSCTVDFCDGLSNLCEISETLDDCCGNGMCEKGEGRSCNSDCGPFRIAAPSVCEEGDCHALDGFMIDVGLSNSAPTKIHISSIDLAYSSPTTNDGATIDVYVSTEGSYLGKETSSTLWERVTTVRVSRYNQKRETRRVEIPLQHSVPLNVGKRRGLYFAASEEIVLFGEGTYSLRNDDGVELHSSLAVSGLYGDGIDGFGLGVEVGYTLDDGSEDSSRLGNGSEDDGSGESSYDGDDASPPPTASPSARGTKSDRNINSLVDILETLPPSSADPTADPVSPRPTSSPSTWKSDDDIQHNTITEEDDLASSSSSSPSSRKPTEEVQLNSPVVESKASSGSTYQFPNQVYSVFAALLIVALHWLATDLV